MLKCLLVLQILCLSVSIYSQNTNLNNKKDLRTEYDIENIKLSETMRVNNQIEYTNYFSRQGDTISVYDWAINVKSIKRIQENILDNFILNDFTYANGSASMLLLIDYERNIFEIRIMRGITDNFNKELLRVINNLENKLILICSSDCKTPIVTPFAIRLR